jgi:hypothetical protein
MSVINVDSNCRKPLIDCSHATETYSHFFHWPGCVAYVLASRFTLGLRLTTQELIEPLAHYKKHLPLLYFSRHAKKPRGRDRVHRLNERVITDQTNRCSKSNVLEYYLTLLAFCI